MGAMRRSVPPGPFSYTTGLFFRQGTEVLVVTKKKMK
jgi:hypothetical protein